MVQGIAGDKPRYSIRDYYGEAREIGLPPIQIRGRWDELQQKIGKGMCIEGLVQMAVGIVVVSAIIQRNVRYSKLWIKSPTNKTTIELPFYTAIRIVNKRRWHLTKVEPSKSKRKINRIQAFIILLKGDNGGKG